MLKNRNESGGGLNFYARLRDGSYVMAQSDTTVWNSETNSCTARLTLPMTESGITYYLATPDGTVCLASEYGHELCDLSDGTQLQVWCSVAAFSNLAEIAGHVSLDVYLPWMLTESNSDLGEPGAPQVKVWLVWNGARVAELQPENPQEYDGREWWYDLELCVSSDKLDPAPQTGDRIWLEYEVDFGNGLSAAGTGDESWSYTASGTWDMCVQAPTAVYVN